jgi:hypothetical protein
MAEKIDEQDILTLEELAISNSFEIAAMFNIMERKGLITRDEFQEELKRLRTEH